VGDQGHHPAPAVPAIPTAIRIIQMTLFMNRHRVESACLVKIRWIVSARGEFNWSLPWHGVEHEKYALNKLCMPLN
jgi:hypothetical protein